MADAIERSRRRKDRGGEVVGQLLDPAVLGRLAIQPFWRHRRPGQDMEKLMGQVEVSPAPWLATVYQGGAQFRDLAGCSGHPRHGIDHQHQYAQALFHHLRQPLRRRLAEAELVHKGVRGLDGVFEGAGLLESQPRQDRAEALAVLLMQDAVGSDPLARPQFIVVQCLTWHVLLPPREAALARDQERIGQHLQRDVEGLHDGQQLVGLQPPITGLDLRNDLMAAHAEKLGHLLLRDVRLLPERLDARPEFDVAHVRSPELHHNLALTKTQDFIAIG